MCRFALLPAPRVPLRPALCLLGAEAAPPCPCGASAVPGAPLVPATLPVPCQRGCEPGHCSCSARGTEARYRAAGRESSMLPQRARGARGCNPLLRLAGAMHPCGVSRSCIYLRRLPPPPCPMPVPSPAAPDLSADIAGRNKAVRPSVRPSVCPQTAGRGGPQSPASQAARSAPRSTTRPFAPPRGRQLRSLGRTRDLFVFLWCLK